MKQIQGQMNIFDFLAPDPKRMTMKEYLTRLGFKNDYFERPQHMCDVEVADIHEYPKVHFYPAKYVNSFGHIVQEYPQACGYECHWWREKEEIFELDIKGICDDPYCPKCGRGFWTEKKRNEVDIERCPDCGIRISWILWHRINDKEEIWLY